MEDNRTTIDLENSELFRKSLGEQEAPLDYLVGEDRTGERICYGYDLLAEAGDTTFNRSL